MEYFDFTETLIFERKAVKLIGDDEIAEIQLYLCRFHEHGRIIPNSGGIRKLRWAASGHGKRGGARVIYYAAISKGRILLLDIYAKNEKADLTSAELRNLQAIVEKWK